MPITTVNDIYRNIAIGKGFSSNFSTASAGTTTGAAAASGHMSFRLNFNFIGTTLPTTLVGFQLTPSPPSSLLHIVSHLSMDQTTGSGACLVMMYLIGTLNLAATGDQFTHDSTWTELGRTQFGVANQPLTLFPMLYVTDATDTTAPIFRLRTNAGASGYVNQNGTGVIGTKSFTFPSTTTTINSAFMLLLEDGDSGVRDITNVLIDTATSATSTATLFGVEFISWLPGTKGLSSYTIDDVLFGGLAMMNLLPAVPNSGTVTSYLGIMIVGTVTSGVDHNIIVTAVLNT